MNFCKDDWTQVLQGDVRVVLPELPEHSVDMCMTSPPFYGLRKYDGEPVIWDGDPNCKHEWVSKEVLMHNGRGDAQKSGKFSTQKAVPDEPVSTNFCLKCGAWKGQLGLEPNPDLYIKHLCDIFDQCKRVLKKTGTLWVNIDDSYNSHAAISKKVGGFTGKQMDNNPDYANTMISMNKSGGTIPDKSLIGIPARFQLEMIRRGWICRNDIVWEKGNPMPESVKDRFTTSWEHLFMFSQQGDYYFEQQFEEYTKPLDRWGGQDLVANGDSKWNAGTGQDLYRDRDMRPNPLGRNFRDVWHINTKGYAGAHFATFPPKLCEIPIKAGCPEFVCTKCGKPREKIYKKGDLVPDSPEYKPRGNPSPDEYVKRITAAGFEKPTPNHHYEQKFIGYSDCGCGAPFEPGVVMDIFAGSGTTLEVAKKLGRKSIGIELSAKYCRLIQKRIEKIPYPMVVSPEVEKPPAQPPDIDGTSSWVNRDGTAWETPDKK